MKNAGITIGMVAIGIGIMTYGLVGSQATVASPSPNSKSSHQINECVVEGLLGPPRPLTAVCSTTSLQTAFNDRGFYFKNVNFVVFQLRVLFLVLLRLGQRQWWLQRPRLRLPQRRWLVWRARLRRGLLLSLWQWRLLLLASQEQEGHGSLTSLLPKMTLEMKWFFLQELWFWDSVLW